MANVLRAGDGAEGAREAGDAGGARGVMDPSVVLAAERTVLAWMRTGLSLMGFGFVVARFGLFLREIASAEMAGAAATMAKAGGVTARHETGAFSRWMGVTLVLFGVIVVVFAAVQHALLLTDRTEGLRVDRRRRMSGWVAVWMTGLLGVVGVVMAGYLMGVR